MTRDASCTYFFSKYELFFNRFIEGHSPITPIFARGDRGVWVKRESTDFATHNSHVKSTDDEIMHLDVFATPLPFRWLVSSLPVNQQSEEQRPLQRQEEQAKAWSDEIDLNIKRESKSFKRQCNVLLQ